MIEELPARIRGADKWPETQVTAVSVDRIAAQGRSPARASIKFNYKSASAESRSGSFYIGDQSSLFNLDENDTFPVRYNPDHPEHHFSGEYVLPFWWKFYGVLLGAFALVFLYCCLTKR